MVAGACNHFLRRPSWLHVEALLGTDDSRDRASLPHLRHGYFATGLTESFRPGSILATEGTI
jgi:hypothetical protein